MSTYGPYSPYQVANGLVFTAGQVGAIKGKASRDIKPQVKQALSNLRTVLESAGTDLGHVVKTTVYLTDMRHFVAMNEVYGAMFGDAGAAPSRTCVGVTELPRVADNALLVEIEAIATLPEAS